MSYLVTTMIQQRTEFIPIGEKNNKSVLHVLMLKSTFLPSLPPSLPPSLLPSLHFSKPPDPDFQLSDSNKAVGIRPNTKL